MKKKLNIIRFVNYHTMNYIVAIVINKDFFHLLKVCEHTILVNERGK